MPAIWSLDGYLAADAEAIEASGENAIEHAYRIADEWGEPVELCDDTGAWLVHPRTEAGTRTVVPYDGGTPRDD